MALDGVDADWKTRQPTTVKPTLCAAACRHTNYTTGPIRDSRASRFTAHRAPVQCKRERRDHGPRARATRVPRAPLHTRRSTTRLESARVITLRSVSRTQVCMCAVSSEEQCATPTGWHVAGRHISHISRGATREQQERETPNTQHVAHTTPHCSHRTHPHALTPQAPPTTPGV